MPPVRFWPVCTGGIEAHCNSHKNILQSYVSNYTCPLSSGVRFVSACRALSNLM